MSKSAHLGSQEAANELWTGRLTMSAGGAIMSPIAHMLSASLVAVTYAQVSPDETPYITVALISATVIDLDHVGYVIRDRAMYRRVGYAGQLHHSRLNQTKKGGQVK